MFLRQLQLHSRPLSILLILFVCGQLFVVLIWGIVITPFYNYGMYSEPIAVEKNYQLFEVELNGKMLRGQDFSPQQWDKVLMPLQYYAGIKKSNALYSSDIKRLLNKMHIASNNADFLQHCSYEQFEPWYKNYLESITHRRTNSLFIHYRLYKYQSNQLVATDTLQPLSQLCN